MTAIKAKRRGKKRLIHPGRTQATRNSSNSWVATVKTDSTHPPEGLFTKSASTIARRLASKEVSPKGVTSGLRMLTYFINRAGEGLSAARRTELEKAKAILSNRIRKNNEKKKENLAYD